MTELNAEHARRAIVEHTRRLAESAATAGPDAAVPTTPEWTITDLVEHVGQTQHWVAEIIERRITDPTQLPTGMAVLPTDLGDWPAWLSQSAQRVASACADDALDAPVFNPAADGRSGTRFWMSSLLNEAVVHGFDSANVWSVIAMAVLAMLLYGTLIFPGRPIGYISTLLVSIFALGMPIIHLRSVRINEIAQASGGFFFIWTLWALGITGILGIIISAEGIWGLLRRTPQERDVTSNSS